MKRCSFKAVATCQLELFNSLHWNISFSEQEDCSGSGQAQSLQGAAHVAQNSGAVGQPWAHNFHDLCTLASELIIYTEYS